MKTLVIDIGNSRIKAAIYENHQYQSGISFSQTDDVRIMKVTFEQWISDKNIKHIGISNVGSQNSERLSFLYEFSECTILEINSLIKLPFQNLYHTPATLGADRLCGVAAGMRLFPNSPILVIDAGTAITYDYLNHENQYLGGAISPGMTLKFKSLNQYTAKLPLVNFQEDFSFIGKTTLESIRTGVQSATIAEVEGMIQRFSAFENHNLITILTGGDAQFLNNHIEMEKVFFEPNLVLAGIDNLIHFNYS